MTCDHNFTKLEKDLLIATNKSRMPFAGSIALTHNCNLSCVHCYAKPFRNLKEISYNQVCNLLDQIADTGCLIIGFTGGEPLIREDFPDIFKYAKKKGFLIEIISNGTLINEELIKLFKKYPPKRITITLYGFSEDTYQKITKRKGMFKKCLDNILLIHQNKLPLELKTLLSKFNIKEIEKMQKFARSLGLTLQISENTISLYDGSKEHFKFALTPKELVEFNFSNKETKKVITKKFKNLSIPKEEYAITCGAGKTIFHIDPSGNLQMCHTLQNPKYNLLKGSFKNGWENFKPKCKEKWPKESECAKCKLLNSCNPCQGEVLLESGQLGVPSTYRCNKTKLTYAKIRSLKLPTMDLKV